MYKCRDKWIIGDRRHCDFLSNSRLFYRRQSEVGAACGASIIPDGMDSDDVCYKLDLFNISSAANRTNAAKLMQCKARILAGKKKEKRQVKTVRRTQVWES